MSGLHRRLLRFALRYFYAAGSCFYLFLGGFLRDEHRTFLYEIGRHFGLRDAEPDILPSMRLSDLAVDVLVDVREPLDQSGGVSALQLVAIAKLVRARRPAALFEIGTFRGRTTLNLAANAPPDAKVYSLDLPRQAAGGAALPLGAWDRTLIDKERSGEAFAGTELGKKVVQLYGDSASFDFSPYFGAIDFVFVDGAHGYEYALNDSRVALKLLRGGKGMILWDDYGGSWEGVTRAINELYRGDPAFKDLVRLREGGFVCYVKD